MNLIFFGNRNKSFSFKPYDQTNFYEALNIDLETCEKELIIETPSISTYRMYGFVATFKRLTEKGVSIYIFTKKPGEKDSQAHTAIKWLSDNGIQVFESARGNNRRMVFIDRKIMWEGSLEILSQEKSMEFMRRIDDPKTVKETIKFLRYHVVIN